MKKLLVVLLTAALLSLMGVEVFADPADPGFDGAVSTQSDPADPGF